MSAGLKYYGLTDFQEVQPICCTGPTSPFICMPVLRSPVTAQEAMIT